MITSNIKQLRDPFILREGSTYYAYGTNWVCYENTDGRLDGDWKPLGQVAVDPENIKDQRWAPEVHRYGDAYYMFTTYRSAVTGHRGCTIMRSDSPKGPFREITDGFITPHDWDSIDGTLYIDKEGQPWMVFVHEWTCMPDKIGSFAAAKLSADFTHFVSEPMELFRARDPKWACGGVTDGCFLYTTKEGELLMLWSNWDAHGYCVAISRSDNGRLDGNWSHDEELLYSKSYTGVYDGGHGMLFYDTDGRMYLSFHSPNGKIGERLETPVFLPVREENGTIVWDEPKPIA